MRSRNFAIYAWSVLALNLLVIVWGGFVRATGSGAGCGNHWPLCNGEVVPRAPQLETLIEFSHRLTSGAALISVVVLLIWAFRAYPKGNPVRAGAVLAMVLMVIEALIGAGLVLFEYVASDVSIARAYWIAGHLINTFLLLAAVTLTAWWASGGSRLRVRGQGVTAWTLGAALLGILVLGASGGITALGDTLVLTAGISPEESPFVSRLVELRIYHPLIAFAVGGLLLLAAWVANKYRPSTYGRRLSWLLGVLFVAQLVLGAVNVAFKAPVAVQMSHLLLSDLIWIALVLLAATALSADYLSADAMQTAQPISPTQPQGLSS